MSASVACSSGSSLGEVGVYDDAGAFHGGLEGDATVGLSVSLAPSEPAICAGQCIDLVATATGGTPPYTYAWSGGLAAAARQTVCPSTTTTYDVTATDTAGHAGEFAVSNGQESAHATVTVGSTCATSPEGGAPEGGGLGTHLPDAVEICSVRWSASKGLAGGDPPSIEYGEPPLVATDPTGDMIVASTIASPADGGAGVWSGEIRKFDSQCRPLWTREYTSQNPSGASNVAIEDLAVDASSNIVFVGSMVGSVNFGSGTVSAFGPGAAYVTKLDPDGNGLWTKVYADLTLDLNAVTTDPGGDVILAAEGLAGVDFGGGPIGVPAVQTASYAVELKPDGGYGSGSALPYADYFTAAASGPTEVVLATIQVASVVWPGGPTTPNDNRPILGGFDPLTSYAWSASVPTSIFDARSSNGPSTRVLVGPSKNVVVMYGTDGPLLGIDGGVDNAQVETPARGVAAFSPTGRPLWTDESDFVGETVSPFLVNNTNARLMALDANERVLLGADVQQATTDWDVDLRRLDATGHVSGAARWGGTGPDHLLAMTSDPNGHAVVLGIAAAAPSLSPQTMELAKLSF